MTTDLRIIPTPESWYDPPEDDATPEDDADYEPDEPEPADRDFSDWQDCR